MNSTSDRAETARIADQLRRAVEGDNWTGRNLVQLLDGLTDAQALARPIAGTHTIAELVMHVAVWLEVATRRLAGETYEPATEVEDWPLALDAAGWVAARVRFDAAYRGLLLTLDVLTDERLTEATPGKPYTHYVLLHGIVQHVLYHAGQIALLRRAQGLA